MKDLPSDAFLYPAGVSAGTIVIQKSATADSRTCGDPQSVTLEQLLESSCQHIGDVGQALAFFAQRLHAAAEMHDRDKLGLLEWFHQDFSTGFERHGWLDRHYEMSRHHLQTADGVPADVDLVDVIECVVDCVMAGMGRSGEVRPVVIPSEVLQRAVENTAALLAMHVSVAEHEEESKRE